MNAQSQPLPRWLVEVFYSDGTLADIVRVPGRDAKDAKRRAAALYRGSIDPYRVGDAVEE